MSEARSNGVWKVSAQSSEGAAVAAGFILETGETNMLNVHFLTCIMQFCDFCSCFWMLCSHISYYSVFVTLHLMAVCCVYFVTLCWIFIVCIIADSF